MYDFLEKVLLVKNSLSTSAFARILGMQQKTVDFYLRGERKPSVEFVKNICSKFNVSADWLLGLPDHGNGPNVTNNGGPVAIGAGASASTTTVTLHPECENCKYKRLADAFKAL